MKSIVVESQYLPGIAYFSLLASANTIIIDGHENYVRQTYRNRAEILGPNGIINLTVPVERGRSKQLMKETLIDNTSNWQKIHWRSIQSSYGKSPFFEYYADQLVSYYEREYRYLVDLNHDLLSCLLKVVDLDVQWSYSKQYVESESVDIQDYRSIVNPKRKKDYLEKLSTLAYPQVFGSKFVTGMSLIDMLFCEGPNTGSMIRKMAMMWH
ncbi:MAG: WbqC family protein [Cyclobacteriaceae bacterium]